MSLSNLLAKSNSRSCSQYLLRIATLISCAVFQTIFSRNSTFLKQVQSQENYVLVKALGHQNLTSMRHTDAYKAKVTIKK